MTLAYHPGGAELLSTPGDSRAGGAQWRFLNPAPGDSHAWAALKAYRDEYGEGYAVMINYWNPITQYQVNWIATDLDGYHDEVVSDFRLPVVLQTLDPLLTEPVDVASLDADADHDLVDRDRRRVRPLSIQTITPIHVDRPLSAAEVRGFRLPEPLRWAAGEAASPERPPNAGPRGLGPVSPES